VSQAAAREAKLRARSNQSVSPVCLYRFNSPCARPAKPQHRLLIELLDSQVCDAAFSARRATALWHLLPAERPGFVWICRMGRWCSLRRTSGPPTTSGTWGSLLNWKIESSNEPLRDQPDGQAGFSIDAKLPKQARLSSTTVWEGRRYDFQVPAPAIDSVGGYSTTNLVVGYNGVRRIGLFARVDNFFNRRFHEYLGFPNPGISCQVGVMYHIR